MDHYDILSGNCQATIESLAMAVDSLAPALGEAADAVAGALLQDRKIIACGDGPDAALAQLFSINMLGHFQQERPALPAMTLTADGGVIAAIACQDGRREIFSRQLNAIGQAGDLLLCIASAPASDALLAAVAAAAERNMTVIALSNGGDEALDNVLDASAIRVIAHCASPARALELQTVVIQNLCQLIDYNLFGGYTGHQP